MAMGRLRMGMSRCEVTCLVEFLQEEKMGLAAGGSGGRRQPDPRPAPERGRAPEGGDLAGRGLAGAGRGGGARRGEGR